MSKFKKDKKTKEWSKDDLVRIFRDTKSVSKKIPIPKVHRNINVLDESDELDDLGKISVVNQNCITALRYAKLRGERCAILNMAHPVKVGGGVERGSRAQEEFLCRISNLYSALEWAKTSAKGKAAKLYPLHENGGFIVENVTFFRDENYENIDRFTADVITASAPICRNKSNNPDKLTNAYLTDLRNKIANVIQLCDGYDIVILGAFGCGAFNNPPTIVADLFRKLLVEQKMAKGCQEYVFAIIEDRNSGGVNFSTFKQILDPDKS